MTPHEAQELSPSSHSPAPRTQEELLNAFLGFVSPEAAQESLDALGYSTEEHWSHVVTLCRSSDPAARARGLSLFESMHDRRIRLRGLVRDLTLTSPGGSASDVTAHLRTTSLAGPGTVPPSLARHVPGIVVRPPSDAALTGAPPAARPT